jgi:AcrR family transcriptional regulator
MVNEHDPRVIRTRQMLRDALVALILEKGYDGISVQDITERAGLRRATFYLHYADKEELVFTLLRDMLLDFDCRMDALCDGVLTPETERIVQRFSFEHARENADLYRALARSKGAQLFIDYTREYVAREIRTRFQAEHPGETPAIPIEVIANYSASVKINMILWWLEQGTTYTPQEMADMCAALTMHGISGALASTPTRDTILDTAT